MGSFSIIMKKCIAFAILTAAIFLTSCSNTQNNMTQETSETESEKKIVQRVQILMMKHHIAQMMRLLLPAKMKLQLCGKSFWRESPKTMRRKYAV